MLFDLRALGGLRPQPPAAPANEDSLALDDLVSRGGDGLGLDVDATGYLVLIEGRDFD